MAYISKISPNISLFNNFIFKHLIINYIHKSNHLSPPYLSDYKLKLSFTIGYSTDLEAFYDNFDLIF